VQIALIPYRVGLEESLGIGEHGEEVLSVFLPSGTTTGAGTG
jgi:hypothetical protein